jgi:hypothetical protein
VDAADIVVENQPRSVRVVNRMALRGWLEGLPDVLDDATITVFDTARRSTTSEPTGRPANRTPRRGPPEAGRPSGRNRPLSG